jgi:hypothetical protein
MIAMGVWYDEQKNEMHTFSISLWVDFLGAIICQWNVRTQTTDVVREIRTQA